MHPEMDLAGILAHAYRQQLQAEAARERVLARAAREQAAGQGGWTRLSEWLRQRAVRNGQAAPASPAGREVVA